MEPLTVDQFPAFFRAVHGFEPFEWQKRFASEVLTGRFYEAVKVPTASGKTSILDVAVFRLALEAHLPPINRTAARRICFVIDRRLVVDEVTEHSCAIRDALASKTKMADKPILRTVSERLAHLAFNTGEPLRVVRLRGGVYRDGGWAADPLTPSIIVSTIDQIGSRLLFRGYGVSTCNRPLQAGLLAFDTLIIVDEAHLSRPFSDLLQSVRRFQERADRNHLPASRRVQVCLVSATLSEPSGTFELTETERKDPALAPRLEASKPTKLFCVPVETVTKKVREKQSARAREQERKTRPLLVEAIVDQAKKLATQNSGGLACGVIGVVLNRVGTAREVFRRLRSAQEADNEVVLLTGRIRPFDRDQLLKKWLPEIKVERQTCRSRPLFVVATQTVEVGANLDFDALVTEAAPLDALRQRFGRVDRLGMRHQAGSASPGAIVVRSDRAKNSDEDPIYGSAISKTWEWLANAAKGKRKSQQAVVDLGINNLDRMIPEPETLRPMLAPSAEMPVLFPAHLDAWAQTDPAPAADPDVAPFLHGREDTRADVQVVWRADLDTGNQLHWKGIVELMPPRTREALPVPVHEVRAWLRKQAEGDIADVEGGASASGDARGAGRNALRWGGRHEGAIVAPDEIRPGDTIVVPSLYGGADRFGWNPNEDRPVQDVAEACLAETLTSYPREAFRRPKLRFRLRPHLLPRGNSTPTSELRRLLDRAMSATSSERDEPWTAVRALLGRLRPYCPDPASLAAVDAFRNILKAPRIESYPDQSGLVITAPVSVSLGPSSDAEAEYEEPDDDEASVCPSGKEISLLSHSQSVSRAAAHFARECGLSEDLVAALETAGLWHDQGKRDPRFQAWLHGSEVRALAALAADKPLAKSGRDLADWGSSAPFGYPRGSRHEFVSVRLFEASASPAENHGLVRFLIGTHHGHGRPFPVAVRDPAPLQVTLNLDGQRISTSSDHRLHRLDSRWADLFWDLIRKYGWWGLAYLEALVITADRLVSAQEQQNGSVTPPSRPSAK